MKMSNRLSRREFTEGVAASAAVTLSNSLAAADLATSVLIDTHLHCFAGKDDARFPYHPRGPYAPAVAATPQHLLKCMDEAGVGHAVVVHPEPYQDDHRYLEHCLKIGGRRLKGTVLLFSDRADSLEKLPDLANRLDLIAVRVHAYAPDRLPPFG